MADQPKRTASAELTLPIPRDLLAPRSEASEAETLVPCPICARCVGCEGVHMVTPSRARALEDGAVHDFFAGSEEPTDG